MKRLYIALAAILLQSATVTAQAPMGRASNPVAPADRPATRMTEVPPMPKHDIVSSMTLTVNRMDDKKKQQLNKIATQYSNTRAAKLLPTIGQDVVMSLTDILVKEAYYALTIRSRQKKEWMELRQKECTFMDSMQSVGGQRDFYAQTSVMGPLDPTGINFDGITLDASKNGHKVLHMVCHIDTSRFDMLFRHSRFYLVLDSFAFYPYHSFLPNLGVGESDLAKRSDLEQGDLDYWNTISHFNFAEHRNPSVRVSIDLYSSWINELVQVFQDVKLGSFWLNIPINENDLHDSAYIYSRREALAKGRPTIDISGGSFVVPRSYMPLDARKPSWGTGEFKMKVVLSEKCLYNPEGMRAKDWHKDYKQLMRLYNNGKDPDMMYLSHPLVTLRESNGVLLKAVYAPLIRSAFATPAGR